MTSPPPPGNAWSFRSLINSTKTLAMTVSGNRSAEGPAPLADIFPRTDPAVDGDECSHDCQSCTVRYPKNFKMEESDDLYGFVKAWETHLLVATGKTDWVRDVEHERKSVMEAFGKASGPKNGKLKLSASNIPTPSGTTDYSEPTSVLLLPAFTVIDHVTPKRVPLLIEEVINKAPTNTSPLAPFALPKVIPDTGIASETNGANGDDSDGAEVEGRKEEVEEAAKADSSSATGEDTATNAAPTTTAAAKTTTPTPAAGLVPPMTSRPCPHQVLVLLCSQKTRDARCGQSAPLIRKELERHLRPLGLYRDLDDERPGGVGIYFISHVGGHKYSANVMVYRRPDAFGIDDVQRAKAPGDVVPVAKKLSARTEKEAGEEAEEGEEGDVGAAQCIWLARVRPEDCENLVRFTILQGKVVKPEKQLRGGFDRGRGMLSW